MFFSVFKMGSFLGSAVFSAAVFFYCLGLIFGVVGYIGDWLVPRDPSPNPDKTGDLLSVGVRSACFNHYTGFVNVDNKEFHGCYDTTKTSSRLSEIPEEDVRPAWYQSVQDMYLAGLIMISLTMILVFGFLISYCCLKQQLKRRQRPSSTLLLSKAALGLWFLLAAIAGALLVAAPLLFEKNYRKTETFFQKRQEFFQYGAGFAITIVGGASLLVSALFGLIVFVTVVKKMLRLSSGDAKMVFTDEFANLDADDTEMERLSNDELDGPDKSQVTHKKAYPIAAPRAAASTSDEPEGRSYQNIPSSRRNEKGEGGQSHQNTPTPRPKSSAAPEPAKRLSIHGATDKQKAPAAYKADYDQQPQQARDRSPMAGNRSVAGESMASTAYPPSTHYSSYSPFMQSRHNHSDTESSVAGRNKSVARSAAVGDNSSITDSNVPRPSVVAPAGGRSDVKHSRYAGAF